jgi:hypothetical protein
VAETMTKAQSPLRVSAQQQGTNSESNEINHMDTDPVRDILGTKTADWTGTLQEIPQ